MARELLHVPGMKTFVALPLCLALASASLSAVASGDDSPAPPASPAPRPAVVVTHVAQNGGHVIGTTEVPHGPLTAAATHVEIRGQKLELPRPGERAAKLTVVDRARLARRGTTMDRPLSVRFFTLHRFEAHSDFGVPYTASRWTAGPKIKYAAVPVASAKK